MFKLFYYLWSNYEHLNTRFLALAFYRKLKRIKYRITSIDAEDKLFLFFLFFNSILGIYSFFSVLDPSLRLAEIFILFPILSIYLYVANKKIIGTKYFHYMGLISLISAFGISLLTFTLDLIYCDGLIQATNDSELSFISQYIIGFINTLSDTLKTSNFSWCDPLSPIESAETKPETPLVPRPKLNAMYVDALWTSWARGLASGAFIHTLKKKPRLTYTVTGTVAIFSFLTDIAKS